MRMQVTAVFFTDTIAMNTELSFPLVNTVAQVLAKDMADHKQKKIDYEHYALKVQVRLHYHLSPVLFPSIASTF